mgnify:CR=1 FL=1
MSDWTRERLVVAIKHAAGEDQLNLQHSAFSSPLQRAKEDPSEYSLRTDIVFFETLNDCLASDSVNFDKINVARLSFRSHVGANNLATVNHKDCTAVGVRDVLIATRLLSRNNAKKKKRT